MCKNCFLSVAAVLGVFFLHAQVPEDALRLSWTVPSGTARQQAIGGAMGSLGGEISAAYVNPAGLGFYKTSEAVLSPGFRFQTNNTDYRSTQTKSSSVNSFNLGTSGLVLGFAKNGGNSSALAITANRVANFSSHVYYKGQNDYSSFSEQYAQEFASSGLSINDGINSPQLSYGTRMALYSYLIDTATLGGTTQVIGLPQKVLNAQGALNQLNSSNVSGGVTEVALGMGWNFHDRFYVGGTLGIPIVNYVRDLSFTETDATGNTNNDFATATYTEHYTSSGGGVNLKIGGIFKPSDEWRIGLAVHSPTWYTLTDNLSATMSTNTENYTTIPQPIVVSSATLDNGSGLAGGSTKYDIVSPWKFLLSGSYVIGSGVENTKSQKGFITADLEYVTTGSSRFSPGDAHTDASYYQGVNGAVSHYYHGTFDLKLGGELKFNTFAARAGVAYYTNPYQDKSLSANRLFVSGGVGYRNKGIFIDLTYVAGFSKNVNFPYRLAAPRANTFASMKENSGTVLLTIGFKL